MRGDERARLAESEREAAAVAGRDATGCAGATEVADGDGFMARFLAFRQCVELMLEKLTTKTTKAKPRRLRVRREELCADVLGHFGFLGSERTGFTKQKLLQRTSVTFIDVHGAEEDGVDQGGLTAEMYSSFFREVLLPDTKLFEGIAEDTGGGRSIGLLPSPDAAPAALEAVGRAICKCVLDDQPIGGGLGSFLFEYLADAHERRVFVNPRAALAALADFDPELAQRWTQLLAQPQEGLTLEMFNETADGDSELAATAEALGGAIVAGCRQRLLSCREASLRAVRNGFTEHADLRIQLGALSSAEMHLLLRGKQKLSAKDLLGCFQMPDASLTAQAVAGFAAAGSEVPRYLRELILDESPETGISEEQRLHVLEWATTLASLPCGGLKDKITLKLWEGRDDHDLPNVHTCTAEVHIPAYSSRSVLRAKLLQAVEHRHDGFNIE